MTERLAPEQLALRGALPTKPAPVTLTGAFVQLQPLDIARDKAILHALSNGSAVRLGDKSLAAYDPDALIWRYMAGGPFASADDLAGWLQKQLDAPDGLPLTVFDRATGAPVGVANLMSNAPAHLSIELGSIWYSPIVQRTAANTEASYLLLRHVFDLGYRRVVWKCDALNERSRRAAAHLGFTFEGIHQFHYIIKERNRDTAWFRMLHTEWAGVRAHLETRLYAAEE